MRQCKLRQGFRIFPIIFCPFTSMPSSFPEGKRCPNKSAYAIASINLFSIDPSSHPFEFYQFGSGVTLVMLREYSQFSPLCSLLAVFRGPYNAKDKTWTFCMQSIPPVIKLTTSLAPSFLFISNQMKIHKMNLSGGPKMRCRILRRLTSLLQKAHVIPSLPHPTNTLCTFFLCHSPSLRLEVCSESFQKQHDKLSVSELKINI